jgi:hypothetical protein
MPHQSTSPNPHVPGRRLTSGRRVSALCPVLHDGRAAERVTRAKPDLVEVSHDDPVSAQQAGLGVGDPASGAEVADDGLGAAKVGSRHAGKQVVLDLVVEPPEREVGAGAGRSRSPRAARPATPSRTRPRTPQACQPADPRSPPGWVPPRPAHSDWPAPPRPDRPPPPANASGAHRFRRRQTFPGLPPELVSTPGTQVHRAEHGRGPPSRPAPTGTGRGHSRRHAARLKSAQCGFDPHRGHA